MFNCWTPVYNDELLMHLYLSFLSQLSNLNHIFCCTKVSTYHSCLYTHTGFIFTYLWQTLSVLCTHPFCNDHFWTCQSDFQISMPESECPCCGLPLPQKSILSKCTAVQKCWGIIAIRSSLQHMAVGRWWIYTPTPSPLGWDKSEVQFPKSPRQN